jgi:hypothetical protein
MSNSKYIQHYRSIEPGLAELLLTEFAETIEPQRTELLKNLYNDTGGAIAHIPSNIWGQPDGISSLVFPEEHPITKEPHIKIVDRRKYKGNRVVSVRGMGNRKDGKAFNSLLGTASAKLTELPMFTQWLIVKYDLERTCLGGPHPGGRGTSMLSTSAGLSSDSEGVERCVLFAIPKKNDDDKRDITLPAGFEKISYGIFYDLVNGDDE